MANKPGYGLNFPWNDADFSDKTPHERRERRFWLQKVQDGATSLIDLATQVTGILRVMNGGTGRNSLTLHGVVIGNGSSTVNVTTAGVTGQALVSVTGADPVFGADGILDMAQHTLLGGL